MGVSADDDGPFVHGEVVEDLVDDVGHGVVFFLRIASGDEAEFVHEGHELRDVVFGFLIPNGGGVAAGLITRIDDGGNGFGGHGFELLGGHEAGGVLRADDVHLNADVGSGVQGAFDGDSNGVFVENFLNGGEALAWVGDFFRSGEDGGGGDAEGLGGEGLELFPEDDGVGSAFRVFLFDPVLEVETDAAGDVDGGEEDG